MGDRGQRESVLIGRGGRDPIDHLCGDGGYQGASPITPHKKPPGGALTAKQKAYNYSVNRLRAAVERAISHLKNWKSSRPATTGS
jgi:hypothetical protein